MSETTDPSPTIDNTFINKQRCFNGEEHKGWGEFSLPSNKIIKSIAATAGETIILTESRELYTLQIYSKDFKEQKYLNKIDNYKNLYNFNFTLFAKDILKMEYNIPKIKEIFCNCGILILQLENDEYILISYDHKNIYGKYIKDNFKLLATCTLSYRFIAINSKLFC
ncbi:hypothetical protein ABK040_004807 [Willaertia magna]